MGLKAWISRVLDLGGRETKEVSVSELFEASSEVYARELAFWTCVNLVANVIAKCEFRTFYKGEEKKDAESYSWNREPNKNQSSSAFRHKLIAKLFSENEALVIDHGGQFLIADSYNRKEYALYEDIFSQVQIGDFTFDRSFTQSEVMFFQLSAHDMKPVADGIYAAYQKLIAYGMKTYQQSRGRRGVVKISTMARGAPQFDETFNKLMGESLKTFYQADSAALPLFEGYDYSELDKKTYANEGTRDIRAMIDDVSDFTAKAFGIPPVLLHGNVEGVSDALDNFFAFCINPICHMLEDEINRKRNGLKGYQAGTHLQIDTRAIKHIDLLSAAASIDKLISSGAFCVNDIRRLVGERPINEDWANQHMMTKNYATVADLLANLEGG